MEVLRLLNQLLELLNSRFPRFHSTTDFACLIADRGQGSVQFLQSEDALFRKEIDRFGNGFEFVCGVLLLPTLRILPALCFLNIQIAEQQCPEVGRFCLLRLGSQGFLCLENLGQPFFQLANLRPDFTEHTVSCLDAAIEFATLGNDAFLLHL